MRLVTGRSPVLLRSWPICWCPATPLPARNTRSTACIDARIPANKVRVFRIHAFHGKNSYYSSGENSGIKPINASVPFALMKKIQITLLFIGVLGASHLQAQNIDEIGTRVFVESHCSAYAEVYRCFDIDESQCREMMSIIVPACTHKLYVECN